MGLIGTWNGATGEWRKPHKEECNDLYCLPNIARVIKLRRMRLTGHVARMQYRRCVYSVLVGKSEKERPLGRPKRRWGYIIKMDLQQVGCELMDWFELAQDMDRWRALVKAIKKTSGSIKLGEIFDYKKPFTFSRTTVLHEVSKEISEHIHIYITPVGKNTAF